MKKKKIIFGGILLVVIMVFNISNLNIDNNFQFKLSDLILTAHANGETNTGCSATANCYLESMGGTNYGTISCTGTLKCFTSYELVKCDGVEHLCAA